MRFTLYWSSHGLAALFLTALLSGCGGGGVGQQAPGSPSGSELPTNPDGVVVKTAIDPSLQTAGSLSLPTTMTVVDSQATGANVSSLSADSAVYAVDKSGDVALASLPVNGVATFSGESTVIAFGVLGLAGVYPEKGRDDLVAALRNSASFDALARAIENVVRSGSNPLDDSGVQQGFDDLLVSVVSGLSTAQDVRRPRPEAIAPNRLEPAYEPTVFEANPPWYFKFYSFKVSIANQSAGVYDFGDKVLLRNTSSVFFDATLVDTDGVERTSSELKGAGASLTALTSAVPLEMNKDFPGSFSIRLRRNDDANKAELIKAALSVAGVGKTCGEKIAKIAIDSSIDVIFGKRPLPWLNRPGICGGSNL